MLSVWLGACCSWAEQKDSLVVLCFDCEVAIDWWSIWAFSFFKVEQLLSSCARWSILRYLIILTFAKPFDMRSSSRATMFTKESAIDTLFWFSASSRSMEVYEDDSVKWVLVVWLLNDLGRPILSMSESDSFSTETSCCSLSRIICEQFLIGDTNSRSVLSSVLSKVSRELEDARDKVLLPALLRRSWRSRELEDARDKVLLPALLRRSWS